MKRVRACESEISDKIKSHYVLPTIRSSVRKIVKTNNVVDEFNKMCNDSGTVLNLKYTDSTTQLR